MPSSRSSMVLGLVLGSCAKAPPEPVVPRAEQTDIECQDLDGLSFAQPEAWSTVSEDYLAYAVWLDDAVYRFDTDGTVRQDVAALTVFDGVLYAGIGDW